MDKKLTEAVAESDQELKAWSAPKLIEADVAGMTEYGGNSGMDGLGSASTLS